MDTEQEIPKQKKTFSLPASILTAAVILSLTWVYVAGPKVQKTEQAYAAVDMEEIAPSKGVELPVTWGDLGARMVSEGVIDSKKLKTLYKERGGLSESDKALLYGTENGKIVITNENSGLMLNMLWAFGLSNKNEILEQGEMMNPKYGGADRFASTGGWILSDGDPMDHYSKHQFVTLTKEQQQLVAKVAATIYRPCCDNPTHFPDCNHGMAMLGLLELMAAQGVTEDQMYAVALQVNSYWFPSNYQTLATYLESKGMQWDEVDPKDMLGKNFSSGSAFRQIQAAMNPKEHTGGVGCGA